jgi:hypothetical protein
MMYSAASVGSDEVLQWLRDENRVQYDVTLLRAAAAHYQLSTVQYLRSQGCPWDASACSAAVYLQCANAESKSLETLQWLHENGCPWEVADVRIAAARSGSVSTLAYAVQHDNPPDATEWTQLLNVAGTYRKLEAAKWLRQQGAEWPTVVQCTHRSAMVKWHGEVLAWARSEGFTSEGPFCIKCCFD